MGRLNKFLNLGGDIMSINASLDHADPSMVSENTHNRIPQTHTDDRSISCVPPCPQKKHKDGWYNHTSWDLRCC